MSDATEKPADAADPEPQMVLRILQDPKTGAFSVDTNLSPGAALQALTSTLEAVRFQAYEHMLMQRARQAQEQMKANRMAAQVLGPGGRPVRR